MKQETASKLQMAAMILFAVAAVVFAAASCTANRDDARSALMAQGFEEIRLGADDVVFSGCGQGEAGVKFVAKNARGRDVAGTVCCGTGLSIKMCTVRF